MNILSYIYDFFKLFLFLFTNFQGPNLYHLQDEDAEYITIERTNDLIVESLQYDIITELELEPQNSENAAISPMLEQLEQQEQNNQTRRTTRKCGYCRQVGHYVTDCTNNEVVTHVRELEVLVNNATTTPVTIRQWMENKSERLIKVILCKMHLVRFTATMTLQEFENCILEHIAEVNAGRQALQNIINNVNEIVTGYQGELQLPQLSFTDTEVYNKLSITTSEVTNNSEDIICPICYEAIEQKNICKTDCNHEFCKDCIHKSLRDNIIIKNESACPLCRNKITHLFLQAASL
jgi:predicted DNA-binding protein YlxM (UPF0122 family)